MSFTSNFKQMLLRLAFLVIERNSAELARNYPRMAVFSFDYIGNWINAYGRYENASLLKLRDILLREGITSTALDVGANVGNHTVFFAEFFDHVIALEPNPATYSVLQLNTEHLANVTCLMVGASSARDALGFQVNERNTGDARVTPGAAGSGNGGASSNITIDVLPLDAIDDINSRDIGMIKIDVQGHELGVIRGALELLRQKAPVIAFEQEAREVVNGSSATMEEIRRAGYHHFYAIEPRRSMLSPSIPGVLRIPMQLLEILLRGDGTDSATFREVGRLENRQYSMLLASRFALAPP